VFRFWRTSIVTLALGCISEAQPVRRAFAVNETRYTVRDGERVEISSAPESAMFARSAKKRGARASGRMIRKFSVGPTPDGDRVMLGVPLMTR
jgi:hypothetical protein